MFISLDWWQASLQKLHGVMIYRMFANWGKKCDLRKFVFLQVAPVMICCKFCSVFPHVPWEGQKRFGNMSETGSVRLVCCTVFIFKMFFFFHSIFLFYWFIASVISCDSNWTAKLQRPSTVVAIVWQAWSTAFSLFPFLYFFFKVVVSLWPVWKNFKLRQK